MISLDMECAKAGKDIFGAVKSASDPVNLLRRILGVLQEDGVYAHLLYINAKAGDYRITQGERTLLKLIDAAVSASPDLLQYVREDLSKNLDKLFLAKRLLERALIYALYHARAGAHKERTLDL